MKGIKEYISYIRTRQEYLKKFVGEDYPLTEIRFYRELEAAIKEWGRNHKLVYKYLLGEVIASYEGKIDIDDNTNGSIMFDMDGKRYVYYNAIIEVIEK